MENREMQRLRVLLVSFIFLVASCVTVNNTPEKEVTSESTYEMIGNSVYHVGSEDGWGTGFAVEARSGKKFILTNDHVCDGVSKNDRITASDGKKYLIKVKAKYDKHDLCLMLAPKNAKPLEIAGHLDHRERIFTAGFPSISGMTTASGVALKMDEDYDLPYPLENKDCKGKSKYKVKSAMEMTLFGPVEQDICFMIAPTQLTSIRSGGGASGSPVVNKYGEVTGVVLSVSQGLGFASMVPLNAIRDFLNNN